jgi:hypothetical protein
MENTAKHYFAGRCIAKLAAIECLSWHHWNHQTHMDAMANVNYTLIDHEQVSGILDELTIFLENQEGQLSEVLSDLDIDGQSRRSVKAFKDGVKDELMHIRTFQRDYVDNKGQQPAMAH